MIPRSLLHATFRTGIAIKAFDGILETIGGVLLWFVKPATMNRALHFVFQHELSRDPHDFFAEHVLHFSANVAHGSLVFASLFLLSHGIVKIVLAVALWMNDLWAYPLAIFVFGAFTVYQIYRYAHTHSLALLILTVFDAAVVWLTWEEYGAQKSARHLNAAS
ncbi:MAG: DUF2127 domain-containing protein [Candidatus Acidiferrales bacterium]